MEIKKIKCDCGQENQLVLIEGVWHFNRDKHGNGEEANGCFNCHKPFKELQPKEPEQSKTKADAEIKTNAETKKKDKSKD